MATWKIWIGAVILLCAACVYGEEYDLVILGGRVMDPETMLDAKLNVGVKDGIIATITPDSITGTETIDASGHVVAPGFIDTHFHALDGLSMKMAARDGVTTGMDLEIGAININDWYAAKKNKWPVNYGVGISQEGVRMLVHDPEAKIQGWQDAPTILGPLQKATTADGVAGWASKVSNREEMNQILQLLDEGFAQGAINLASTTAYMREGLTAQEMYESQKLAADWGRFTASHTRYHGSSSDPEAEQGANELIANAFVLDAGLLILHNNDYGWAQIEEKLQAGRAKGLNWWSEYYPYDAASTAIGSGFFQPEVFVDRMGGDYERDMYDPTQDKFLTKEEYEKIAKSDPGRLVVIFSPARKKWLPQWLRIPHMTVASDAIFSGKGVDSWDLDWSEYQGHPRTGGTRAKVIRLGREQGVPLMFSLAQMSYWPAYHLGKAGLESMKVRGRMQEGMVADIVVFDPLKTRETSTYKAGEQGNPSTGIPYVIVNGQQVVKDNKFLKVWAGQPIRYPSSNDSKFEPISEEEWLDRHAIRTHSVHENLRSLGEPDDTH
ncbi:aminoacylase [Microbulbifer agarilyticus]|uniref:Aminoacylase n=1 Tax=Microbulbifer agarilyticus TaxID=260552 RepID=A0A1Q2M1D8_9GAMM|nr:aminoacylase [Microbulbifer agarilyticus]AQQ66338.1 aminoacylase [Microbulbifer agarilyticus]